MPEIRVCRISGKAFQIRGEDFEYYKKINVPAPTLCPEERSRRRFVFRNERTLYSRQCDLCKKKIISIYSPDKKLTVYCQLCWWGDRWSAQDFGRDFDFSKPFFPQFHELLKIVPRYALYNVKSINSDFCHQMLGNKNCYLCFVFKGCEDCLYLSHATNSKNCVDCRFIHECELCYECIEGKRLYNCSFCEYCQNGHDLYFCYDCRSCFFCFGCTNLRNKSYHIFNKPYSKEEYLKQLRGFNLKNPVELKKLQQKFEEIKRSVPHRATWNINVENSTGDNLDHTKNCHECYDAFEIEDCAYCIWIFKDKDCYDCYGIGDSELIYEGIGCEEVHRCRFNTFVTLSSDTDYSDSCFSSENLFGCVGMKRARYCILNKQYSGEEYKALRQKIIEHMRGTGEYGEFFPQELTPFCYNETIAQEDFPLTAGEALAKGFKWKD